MLPLLPLPLLLLFPHPTLPSTPSTHYTTGHLALLPASPSLSITSWTGAHCTGTAIHNPNLKYSFNVEAETLSYNLSRALGPGEQLDWSGLPVGWDRRRGRRDGGLNEWCGLFDHSVGEGGGTGCVDMKVTLTCFRLWHY